MTTADGRIVEYLVYGSKRPDALAHCWYGMTEGLVRLLASICDHGCLLHLVNEHD